MTKTSAPGKVILLGEHAAVYGNPVLVAAVDLRTHVSAEKREDNNFIINAHDLNITGFEFNFNEIPVLKKKNEFKNLRLIFDAVEKIYDYINKKKARGLEISIKSEIPVASGLGSSASLSSALVLAEYPGITIGNTGVVSDTGIVVSDVMKLKEKFPEVFAHLLVIFRELVDEGQVALENGEMERFGELMNINHGLLSAIGVSSGELEKLVWAARKSSAGAKLCGAGRGGIMLALGDAADDIRNAGGDVIKTKICDEGVRVEE